MRRWTRPKALLVSLLLLLLAGTPAAKRRRSSGKNSQQHTSSSRKRDCELTLCAHASEDDRSNCVLQCQSAECYAKVYADDELEPGEIDEICLKFDDDHTGRIERDEFVRVLRELFENI